MIVNVIICNFCGVRADLPSAPGELPAGWRSAGPDDANKPTLHFCNSTCWMAFSESRTERDRMRRIVAEQIA